MRFSYDGTAVELKGLVAAQLIEESYLNRENKLENKGVLLKLLQEAKNFELVEEEGPAAEI